MKELISKLSQANISFTVAEPMKAHTTFKTGGNAAVFICPQNEFELSETLKTIKSCGLKPFILGNGSNLLVSDEGITDRPVIYIGEAFNYVRLLDENTIEVGAGAMLTAPCRFALEHSLTGLEFAFGIPGSCGGAAYMNAGAYGGEMKDVVVRCNHIDFDGNAGHFDACELDFGYRHSVYSDCDCVITSIVLKLEKGDKEEINAKMRELLQRRKDKQPLESPRAGSVFKRPIGYYGGELIEICGLKGYRIGGAEVSEKHAGFIINRGDATASDVMNLVEHIRKPVFDSYGIELDCEIRYIEG